MTLEQQLKAFLKAHKLISIARIEKDMKVSENTVQKWLTNTRGINPDLIPSLHELLKEYGFKYKQ